MKQQVPPMLGATENKEKFLLWLRKREADGKDIAKKSVAPADATAEWRASNRGQPGEIG